MEIILPSVLDIEKETSEILPKLAAMVINDDGKKGINLKNKTRKKARSPSASNIFLTNRFEKLFVNFLKPFLYK